MMSTFRPTTRLALALAIIACVLLPAPDAHAQPVSAPAKYEKVLFLGNSITRHGPKADIDWSGNWGMAATAESKDYVHLVTKALTERSGTAPEILVNNIADFERGYAAYDIAAKLRPAIDFGADLVILAIGENVPALKSAEEEKQFSDKVLKLLEALKSKSSPAIIVRSCFWANPAKDKALKQACDGVGGTYVDISALSKDEGNYARSERPFKHAGVANHPGDKGMQAIAGAILKAVIR